MKPRSLSRASKMIASENQNQDSKETNNLPGLPETKWKEILDKEEDDMFILGIREEILQKCMKICYEIYLEKQAVSLAVHCAYLAWVKVIGVYDMFKDPGDTDGTKMKESWEPDEEPEPSVIDSWASQCIKAVKPQLVKKEKEPGPENSVCTKEVEESESGSLPSYVYEGEGECCFPSSFSESRVILPTREKSIFSRTLSMSKDSLPLLEPLVTNNCRLPSLVKKITKKPGVEDTNRDN